MWLNMGNMQIFHARLDTILSKPFIFRRSLLPPRFSPTYPLISGNRSRAREKKVAKPRSSSDKKYFKKRALELEGVLNPWGKFLVG